MNKPAGLIGLIIILNACIWGFTMIMSSHALSGTGAYDQIKYILTGGSTASLVLLGGGLSGVALKLKSKE